MQPALPLAVPHPMAREPRVNPFAWFRFVERNTWPVNVNYTLLAVPTDQLPFQQTNFPFPLEFLEPQ